MEIGRGRPDSIQRRRNIARSVTIGVSLLAKPGLVVVTPEFRRNSRETHRIGANYVDRNYPVRILPFGAVSAMAGGAGLLKEPLSLGSQLLIDGPGIFRRFDGT